MSLFTPSSGSDQSCSLVLGGDQLNAWKEHDIIGKLESKELSDKIEGMKAGIYAISAGEQYSRLLMSVIKYCLHVENHTMKKLLLLYWEIVKKHSMYIHHSLH